MIFIVGLAAAFFGSPAQAETIKISPQTVVARVLGEGLENKQIELRQRESLLPLALAYGTYDWTIGADAHYEKTRYETFSTSSNLEDRNTVWSVSIDKKLPTGTVMGLSYFRQFQNSVLASSSTRAPYEVMDRAELSVTQNISSNFFGMADRLQVDIARQGVQAASLQKKNDQQDLVLQAIRAFWQAYVAKENLKDQLAARDRYGGLVDYVQNKKKLGFITPGDLPKTRAEYQTQVTKVKDASQTYLAALDNLFLLMRMTVGEHADVEFDIPDELPPLPKLVGKDSSELRSTAIAQINLERATLERKAARLSTIPDVNLYGIAGSNGVDRTPHGSFSEMNNGDHPRYEVGVQLTYYFDSERLRGIKENKEVLYEEAFTRLQQTKDQQQVNINNALRRVQATYAMAKSAIESVRQWELAIAEYDRSFRQGRIDTSQLIIDYNSYYAAQTDKTRAVGDYHTALNELAAAEDKLIE